MRYDVIVVGAGPAGSTTARECAAHGLRTLLLDRATFPRDKPCGGGVTVRAARLLPFDLAPVTERTITGVEFSLRGRGAFRREADRPLAYLTQRRHLDRFLVERAVAAGATLRERTTMRAVERTGGFVAVRGDRETFAGRALVAADGANGRTATLAGLSPRRWPTVALEGNVSPPAGVPRAWHDTLAFDLGALPAGYGWLFPKGDHVNIGVWGWTDAGPRLRAELARQARHYGFAPADLHGVRGHHLPLRRPGSPLADGNLLLVGDAAGLVDPYTGEGIHGAIWSGTVAARHLAAYLSGQAPDLAGYARQVEAEVAAELRMAARLTDLAGLFPGIFMLLGRATPLPWRLIVRLSRGDQGYLGLRRALGPLATLLDLASDLLRASPRLQRRVGLADPPAPERFLRRRVQSATASR